MSWNTIELVCLYEFDDTEICKSIIFDRLIGKILMKFFSPNTRLQHITSIKVG